MEPEASEATRPSEGTGIWARAATEVQRSTTPPTSADAANLQWPLIVPAFGVPAFGVPAFGPRSVSPAYDAVTVKFTSRVNVLFASLSVILISSR